MRNPSVLASFVLLTIACGSDPTPIEACTGAYTCTGGPEHVETQLRKDGDKCTAGKLTLNKDGTVSGVDNATWSGTSKEFKICADGECLVCTSKPTNPPASQSSGSSSSSSSDAKCTGSPSSCSSNSPPNCYHIEGCGMQTRLTYNNNFDNYCAGSPDSCDQMTNEEHCSRQGCTWQK